MFRLTCRPQNLSLTAAQIGHIRLLDITSIRRKYYCSCMLSREKQASQVASIPVQIYSYFYLNSAPLDFYTADSTSNRELLVTGCLLCCLCLNVTDKPLISKISNPAC